MFCAKCGKQIDDDSRFCRWCGAHTQTAPGFDTVEAIRAIPIPKYNPIVGLESPVENIEYILQRKATAHKKNGRMDLAIECLRKSNEIMPYSNFTWAASDYMRLVRYLERDGKEEEAKREEARLREQLPDVFKPASDRIAQGNTSRISTPGFDLMKFTEHFPTCAECSKYQGRVFSISGKDKRFPKLPDEIRERGSIHGGCKHTMWVYVDDLQESWEIEADIQKSNRPFIDGRSAEEKALKAKQGREEQEFWNDLHNQKVLIKAFPDAAPKTFSAYRRMKKANSQNFIQVIEKAKQNGIELAGE